METHEEATRTKRGYLAEDFTLFYLKDKRNLQLETHYHDFNKIILFLSGNVTYWIEGKAYKLKPGDILLVSSSEIHQPVINPAQTYERFVLWMNPLFLERSSSQDANLLTCFQMTSKKNSNLLRLPPERFSELRNNLLHLENTYNNTDFGNRLLRKSLFLQFIININKNCLDYRFDLHNTDIQFDETIDTVLQYINRNLCEDLSIDTLALACHLSKYHLMRRFKQQTGHTLHHYIIKKRLMTANHMLKKGTSVTQACLATGFGDYSNFIRAFKQSYGVSPKKYYKKASNMKKE